MESTMAEKREDIHQLQAQTGHVPTTLDKSEELPSLLKQFIESRQSQLSHSANARKTSHENSASWLRAYRKSAFLKLLQGGMPHAKSEDFKYFPLSFLRSLQLQTTEGKVSPSVEVAIKKVKELVPDSIVLTFIEGSFFPEHSDVLPKGFQLFRGTEAVHQIEKLQGSDALVSLPLLEASVQNDFVSALNVALSNEFCFIEVSKGTQENKPIVVLSLTSDASDSGHVSARGQEVIFHLGDQSSIVVVDYLTEELSSQSFSLAKTHFSISRGSRVQYLKVGGLATKSHHMGQVSARLARDANFEGTMFVNGASQSRNEGYLYFEDQGAHGALNGLTMLAEQQRTDNFTVLKHATPNCTSHELFKSILCDKSIGSFTGTIIVNEGAQKTNAIQNNQTLLMSREATSNTKPQLKIWADDVKCTHGATVGHGDEEALFYLRSRGVGIQDARKMLIKAFAGDVLKEIQNKSLRVLCDALLEKRISELEDRLSFE